MYLLFSLKKMSWSFSGLPSLTNIQQRDIFWVGVLHMLPACQNDVTWVFILTWEENKSHRAMFYRNWYLTETSPSVRGWDHSSLLVPWQWPAGNMRGHSCMPLKMKGAIGAHSQEETVVKARLSTSRPIPAQLPESGRGNMDASQTLLDRSF